MARAVDWGAWMDREVNAVERERRERRRRADFMVCGGEWRGAGCCHRESLYVLVKSRSSSRAHIHPLLHLGFPVVH